jgi:Na+-driven multidrug efflux pump
MSIGYIFSDDEDIVKMVGSIMPIFCGFIFFDGSQGVASGVLRGSGKQKIGAIANLSGYWLFAIPLAWALAFPADLGTHIYCHSLSITMMDMLTSGLIGVLGQWIAISSASMIICTIFLVVIYKTDWPLIARLAHERELKHKADKERGRTHSFCHRFLDWLQN